MNEQLAIIHAHCLSSRQEGSSTSKQMFAWERIKHFVKDKVLKLCFSQHVGYWSVLLIALISNRYLNLTAGTLAVSPINTRYKINLVQDKYLLGKHGICIKSKRSNQ